MKDLWKALFTGLICVIVVGALSAIGWTLQQRLPWLSAATVVADVGIIVGFYKIILDTTKTANELRKTSLEVEKLRLEIEEKNLAKEKAGAHVVAATLDEIEIYGTIRAARPIDALPPSSAARRWARVGSAILILTVFCSAFLAQKWYVNLVYLELALKLTQTGGGGGFLAASAPSKFEEPLAFSCNSGHLFVDLDGQIHLVVPKDQPTPAWFTEYPIFAVVKHNERFFLKQDSSKNLSGSAWGAGDEWNQANLVQIRGRNDEPLDNCELMPDDHRLKKPSRSEH